MSLNELMRSVSARVDGGLRRTSQPSRGLQRHPPVRTNLGLMRSRRLSPGSADFSDGSGLKLHRYVVLKPWLTLARLTLRKLNLCRRPTAPSCSVLTGTMIRSQLPRSVESDLGAALFAAAIRIFWWIARCTVTIAPR